jgi:hypothetical protein
MAHKLSMTILDKFFETDFNEDALGLFKDSTDYDYAAAPIGAKVFAKMGVDGVHYCIAPKKGDLSLENSPVYRISPMDFYEGTVIWTAKNFYDFISFSIVLKDFWALPNLIGDDIGYVEFMNELETYAYEFEIKEENEKLTILSGLGFLKKAFNTIEDIEPKNLFHYIQSAYSDDNNHVKLNFAVPDIKEEKRGFYQHKLENRDIILP